MISHPIEMHEREFIARLCKVLIGTMSGVKDFDVGGWYAVYGPRNLRADLAARYSAAVASVLEDPELKGKLETAGYELWTGGPKESEAGVRKARAMWATVTNDIKVE